MRLLVFSRSCCWLARELAYWFFSSVRQFLWNDLYVRHARYMLDIFYAMPAVVFYSKVLTKETFSLTENNYNCTTNTTVSVLEKGRQVLKRRLIGHQIYWLYTLVSKFFPPLVEGQATFISPCARRIALDPGLSEGRGQET